MSQATTIVVPTLGRASLTVLLQALAGQSRAVDAPVLLVDDRPDDAALELPATGLDLTVLRAGGGGPARARNLGWRHARTTWVSFLDDDVVPDDGWYAALDADLAAAEAIGAAGSEGNVRVPLPTDRGPTDWERGTRGLETARWITADLTYRRSDLSAVGGFDERFPRAFREDADLALRLGGDRGRVARGTRWITHPVRPADDWVSLRQQAGNADDYLMRALHGPAWHQRAEAPVGRRASHVAITLAAAGAVVAAAARRPALAALSATAWAAGTAEFAWARIAPGPRDAAEVRRMVLTSIAIPPAAAYHSLRGRLAHRHARPWRGLPDLVLFDRDGTVIEDVPYNGDPSRVRPVPGARQALERLRSTGVRTALVTNQSGIARGLVSRAEVEAVNARVAELLGPFDAVQLCPHAPDDGCGCRKPAPGMVKQICADLAVDPSRTVVVGDIGSDVEAAEAAGAVGILVPTPQTRVQEVRSARLVEPTLGRAVARILAGDW
jgi:histidinol-phosphate phosphatase family protein